MNIRTFRMLFQKHLIFEVFFFFGAVILFISAFGVPKNLLAFGIIDPDKDNSAITRVISTPLTKGAVVIIGASYVEEWNVHYFGDRPVINKGVTGQETGAMLARFEDDVVALKPAYVLIWGFCNDIFRGERSSIDNKLIETRNNIRQMVHIAQRNAIIPILATEVTIRHEHGLKESLLNFLYSNLFQRSSYQDYVNEKVVAVNQWLRVFAKQKELVLLDFESLLADEKRYRQKRYAAPDGTHISSEGYKAITQYAQSIILPKLD